MVTGFVTWGLINRVLGPSSGGVLAEMQTWVWLFATIFGLSIDSITYHLANKNVYKDDDKVKFTTIFLLNIIYAFLAAAALTLFVFCYPERVSSKTIEFLFLLDMFLIVFMLATNLMIFFQASGNFKFSASTWIAQAFINVAVIVAGYALKIITIKFVILAMIFVQLIGLFMIFRESLRSKLIFGNFSKDIAIMVIKSGIKFHMAAISAFICTKINQLIVFRYCGEEQSGIFAVSLSLAISLIVIPLTFQMALYPRVLHSNDDHEITIRSLRLGFYLWGAVCIAIVFFAKPLLLLYGGPSFLPSVNIFRILMIFTWIMPLSGFVAPYYVKKGAFITASFFAVLLALISIGLNILLVSRYASTGAAMATSLTCLIGFCMALFFIWRLAGKSPLTMFKINFDSILSTIKPEEALK
jgi:O-antigen/teichoic acid export membrane protein